ncbi:hypothetical protein ES708_16120 [subsurface metagenome]
MNFFYGKSRFKCKKIIFRNKFLPKGCLRQNFEYQMINDTRQTTTTV